MRLTFIIPPEFTVYGMPQRSRTPCVVDLDVTELIRMRSSGPWMRHRARRRARATAYLAYARLPGWIEAPEGWPRRDGGAVQLSVPSHFNRKVPFPVFPDGVDHMRLTSEGWAC
ncbi:hypothetical protein H0X90_21710 [Burkholderia sp. 9775_39]|nr:hypothetical protein [Burkholderia sp. 9775_39]MBG0884551.1 hypothetical protein [Burkholderia sp. 9773_38]